MSVVDDIKARLDIVDIVSGYVELKKAGRNFKAPCPFHTEKTPSFIVNPERQSWHCFGACSTGGDIFGFVMRKEGVEFGEALRTLAHKAGIELSDSKRESDKSDALYQINQATARFYQDLLASPQGKQAMAYLDKRGVNDDAREKFGLGLSPGGWDGLKTHLLTLGVTEDQAVEAGVLHRSDNGHTFDFFRDRLMFPIQDRQGRVLGFGGRAFDDSQPKYLNTGQTSLFNKQNILYGLNLAYGTIRAKNTAIVVEGYMDVIAAHQHGYSNVVASMGTALTENQVNQVKSLAKTFVLSLDADAAGQQAIHRSLVEMWSRLLHQSTGMRRSRIGNLYFKEELNLMVFVIPSGKDPDELIREHPEQWEHLLQESATPYVDYLIANLDSLFDLRNNSDKDQAVEFIGPIITSESYFEQDHHLTSLAAALDVRVEAVRERIQRLPKTQREARRQQTQTRPIANDTRPEVSETMLSRNPEDAIEDFVLALLFQRPELRERIGDFTPECFNKIEAREAFTRWLSCPKMDEFFESLDETLQDYVQRIQEKQFAPTDRQESETALIQCLRRLERRYLQQLQENLLSVENPNDPPPRELESAIIDVNARLKEIFAQRA